MLKLLQAPEAFKDVVALISWSCEMKGSQVSEDLVSTVLTSVLLNPDYSFTLKKSNEKEERLKVIHLCVELLTDDDDLRLLIMRLQIYIRKEFLRREEIVKKYEGQYMASIKPLLDYLLRCKSSCMKDVDLLWRRFTLATLLISKFGNPSKPGTISEASDALKTVFSVKDLKAFVNSTPAEKFEELGRVANLVAGIRILNHAVDAGYFAMEECPILWDHQCLELFHKACLELLQKSSVAIAEAAEEAGNLTGFLEPFYFWDLAHKGGLVCEVPLDMSQAEFEYGKSLIVVIHQYKHLLGEVKRRLKEDREQIFELEKEAHIITGRLRTKLLPNRIAVPVKEVYPQFTSLAEIWRDVQNIFVLVCSYKKILDESETIIKSQHIHDFWEKIKTPDTLVSPSRAKYEQEQEMDDISVNCELIFPSYDVQDMLEYNGFCPVYAVEGNGFLVEGDPTIGVLKYKLKYYTFKDVNAANCFGQDPETYILKVVEFSRRHPEFKYLFNLEEDGNALMYTRPQERQLIKHGEGVQTEVHPQESHLDPSYQWNSWELKKDPIKLADMMNSRNRSCQTAETHFRTTLSTQTYWKRTQGMNTNSDVATSVPPLATYVTGLRGRGRASDFLDISAPIEAGGVLDIIEASVRKESEAEKSDLN